MKQTTKQIIHHVILAATLAFTLQAHSAAPLVGKKAAAKYFQNRGVAQNNQAPQSYEDNYQASPNRNPNRYPSSIESLSPQDHYLQLGIGSYSSTTAYNWGNGSKQTDIGKVGFDLTYRLTQDSDLYDEVVRISYNNFEPVGQKASKMSFLYGITFPDAGSQFPLYFGIAAGPGIFFKQVDSESVLSLDYQLMLGLRLFNIFENTGFFIEGGLRNHLHITSDGQLNGTFISVGAVFTF